METVCPQPEIGDVFGRVLTRCWEAGAVPGVAHEIIERDDGYVAAGDAARYFTTAEELSPLDRWACEQASGRILDIGCGAGRHALALSATGKEVLGMDPSPGAVAVTRQRGVDAIVGSIEHPPQTLGTFDTLLLQGNNLALLASPKHATVVLGRLAELARPGTQLVGSNIDPYDDDNPTHVAYHTWNCQRGRLPGQIRMRLRDRRIATPWFDYLLLSQPELRDITAQSPWQLDHLETDGKGYQAIFTLAT